MEHLSKDFVKKLINRRRKVDLTNIDYEAWFDGSWGTINESLRNKGGYGYLRDRKENIRAKVFQQLKSLPSKTENMSDWYKQTIFLIHDDELMTIGRSQKIINILVKYYIANYYFCGKTDKIGSNIKNRLHELHIPIDRIVLKSLREKYPGFKSLINSAVQLKGQDGASWSWSNLTDYDTYTNFQNAVLNKSKSLGYSSPLEFEMNELW